MLVVGTRRGSARARRDPQNGGAAVEFALIMPLFFAIVSGMIDYGWYFYQRFALAGAVRDGIRAGILVLSTTPSPGDPWTTAKTRAIAVLTQSKTIDPASATLVWGPSSGAIGTVGSTPAVKVLTFSGQYTFVPLIGVVPLPKTPMKYSMTMALELEN